MTLNPYEKVGEKALKWTTPFNCFTKSALGIVMNEARKIYNAAAIPKFGPALPPYFDSGLTASVTFEFCGRF